MTSPENWISMYEQSNHEGSYNNFIEIFHSHYHLCIPLTVKYTNSNKPQKYWYTPEIVKSCKTKCKLYKIFMQNPTNLNKQNYIALKISSNHQNC